jgi:hypothetical protein
MEIRRFALGGILPPKGNEAPSALLDTESGGTREGVSGSSRLQSNGDGTFTEGEPKDFAGGVEQWLEREITTHCPAVGRIWFEESTVRVYTSVSESQSTSTDLVVEGTEETFAAVDTLLRGLAAQKQVLIKVTARFVTRPIEQRPEGRPSVTLISRPELAEAVRSEGSISAPELTLFQGQRSMTLVGKELSFVTNYELASAQGQVIADPVISTILEGYQLNVRALVHPDRSTVSTWIDFLTASVAWPVGTRDVTLGEERVTIQVPDVTSSTWSSGMIDVRAETQALKITGFSIVDAESHQLKSVDVFLEITLDEDRRGLAKVVAFDDRSRLVVAELTQAEAPREGAALQIRRGARVLGSLTVERVEGKIVLARYQGVEPPESGDLLGIVLTK